MDLSESFVKILSICYKKCPAKNHTYAGLEKKLWLIAPSMKKQK